MDEDERIDSSLEQYIVATPLHELRDALAESQAAVDAALRGAIARVQALKACSAAPAATHAAALREFDPLIALFEQLRQDVRLSSSTDNRPLTIAAISAAGCARARRGNAAGQ